MIQSSIRGAKPSFPLVSHARRSSGRYVDGNLRKSLDKLLQKLAKLLVIALLRNLGKNLQLIEHSCPSKRHAR